MKLVPLFDKVVLKQLVAEETTASGIVLPGAAKEKPHHPDFHKTFLHNPSLFPDHHLP